MMSVKQIILTVDVEDWFQVENFKPWISFASWPERELRVEQNVHRIMDLFDGGHNGSSAANNGSKAIKATFFILGWLASRLPDLIREICDRGHEVASHGFNHHSYHRLSHSRLKRELIDSKKKLEDIIGQEVLGHRAPCFSVTADSLRMIKESGYQYDSSSNSFWLHSRYGRLKLETYQRSGIAYSFGNSFFEIPVSNLSLSNLLPSFLLKDDKKISNNNHCSKLILPWSGGAYFRMIPFGLFCWGVRRMLASQSTFVFYMHPWEIDPAQPRVENASIPAKFKHYANLGKVQYRLEKFIETFSDCDFMSCADYLKHQLALSAG